MERSSAVSERRRAAPDRRLAGFVGDYVGYRHEGAAPGTHLGLPGPELTVVLSLGAPTRMLAMPDPAAPPDAFDALVGGLHVRPAVIAHDGNLFGIQLGLTPRGARALLGARAGELAHAVVGLDELLGRASERLLERLADADGWDARFAALDAALASRLDARAATAGDEPLDEAWRLLVRSGGAARVAEVAARVGWSRRQLQARFTDEYGIGPKELARVVRFDRARRSLLADAGQPLAAVAAACGYCDQAHMARDWNAFAGCPPSRWIAEEELPFIQDNADLRVSAWADELDY